MKLIVKAVVFSFFLIITACANLKESNFEGPNKIFNTLSKDETGIYFTNNLIEDSIVNYFTYPYIYMGGGVAVGDLNNDGLQDIYFTGNTVENKLYLNRGNLQFDDVTSQSGTRGDDRWMTGVTMIDVNADGWLDIYVSVSGKFKASKNLMYVNKGKTDDGIPRFIEMAEELGIADEGRTTQGTFFDYDRDGDLDLYVANYPQTSFKMSNAGYLSKIREKDPVNSDKLYRNNGNGTFEDVSKESGVLNFGLALSATIGDFDKNGWEDIYVSNDFATPDFLYFNNGDGTFSEKIRETTQHTSFFGMGTDIGDFNNDGLLDILQMDMTPEDNRRNKANMASMNPAGFWEMVTFGLHFQYMQNTLQLNSGIANDGLPHFSDISRLSGLSSTDWSWAGLFVDLDNDGWKDIYITNGTRKDINNKDYFKEIDKASTKKRATFDYLELSRNIPSERIPNYAFRNKGDLDFENVSTAWGLDYKGYSNGASFADLDNDGDLDMIVNNIDDPSIIHENLTSDKGMSNYLRLKLIGSENNPDGIGTKLELATTGGFQYQEHYLTRGFQSSVEPMVHFGLGNEETATKLVVKWFDGKSQVIKNIAANQVLEIDYKNAAFTNQPAEVETNTLFIDHTQDSDIDYLHIENPYNDFQYEVLLPHMYSKNGPGLAVGDINADGLEDFFVGAASGSVGVVFEQQSDGSFKRSTGYPGIEDKDKEDMGATMFDADMDGDLDLYVCSGGNENMEGTELLQDRLYVNNGNGQFEKDLNALPNVSGSGSRVKAADFDNDGDMDLFVGGRIVPKSYPLPAKSYLLRNDSENGVIKFTDATEELSPDLLEAGMVTDAVWLDFDGDNRLDLIFVGEWLPITFLRNSKYGFENVTEDYGFEKTTGWWYSLIAEDFDNDGDKDLIAGNLGLNYKYQATSAESFDVYANDYDENGQLDIVLGYYNNGVQYPLRGRQCSSDQIPAISAKFKDYNSFAEASLEEVYSTKGLESALHYQAWNFASSYIENKGDEVFKIRNLPNEVQISSINGIVSDDVNGDGNLDIIVGGNLYGAEVETTRNDASYGAYLEGDGTGNFRAVPMSESGLFLRYDTKDLAKIETVNGTMLLAANNQDSLKAIKINKQSIASDQVAAAGDN